jgi:hypothetical protein
MEALITYFGDTFWMASQLIFRAYIPQ